MLKIHVEVFIASQVLERELGTFTVENLKHFIKGEFGDKRPGIATHISAHCVANAPLNTACGYNFLWRLQNGVLRTFHPRRDEPVVERLGLSSQPKGADVPTEYRYLLKTE